MDDSQMNDDTWIVMITMLMNRIELQMSVVETVIVQKFHIQLSRAIWSIPCLNGHVVKWRGRSTYKITRTESKSASREKIAGVDTTCSTAAVMVERRVEFIAASGQQQSVVQNCPKKNCPKKRQFLSFLPAKVGREFSRQTKLDYSSTARGG